MGRRRGGRKAVLGKARDRAGEQRPVSKEWIGLNREPVARLWVLHGREGGLGVRPSRSCVGVATRQWSLMAARRPVGCRGERSGDANRPRSWRDPAAKTTLGMLEGELGRQREVVLMPRAGSSNCAIGGSTRPNGSSGWTSPFPGIRNVRCPATRTPRRCSGLRLGRPVRVRRGRHGLTGGGLFPGTPWQPAPHSGSRHGSLP